MMDNTIDTKNMMAKLAKAMKALGFIWNSEEINMETKTKLCGAISFNLLLWGMKIDLVVKAKSR